MISIISRILVLSLPPIVPLFLFRIQCIRFFHENKFISDRAQNDLNQNWREVIFCSNGYIKIVSNCHDLKYCIQRVCFESYLECVNTGIYW